MLSSCLHCSEDMEPAKLRQQILSSSTTVSNKAEDLLLEREVNEMSKDEWRDLIAGIPEDVKREIRRLKSAGTRLYLLTCLLVHGQQLASQAYNSLYRHGCLLSLAYKDAYCIAPSMQLIAVFDCYMWWLSCILACLPLACRLSLPDVCKRP